LSEIEVILIKLIPLHKNENQSSENVRQINRSLLKKTVIGKVKEVF